jgi:hypothetical protein
MKWLRRNKGYYYYYYYYYFWGFHSLELTGENYQAPRSKHFVTRSKIQLLNKGFSDPLVL